MPVYERVLAQLASLDLTEAEEARVRSFVKWAEEGETFPRFFLRKKKSEELIVTVRHVLFGFSSDELLCVPRVVCYLLSLLLNLFCLGMNIVFGPNLQVPWV